MRALKPAVSACPEARLPSARRAGTHASGICSWLSPLFMLGSYISFVCCCAGYTVLHHAVMGGSADIVGILLFTGHGMADTGRESFTPLHLAAHKGHIDLLPFLLKAGYKASTAASDGR